MRKITQTLPGGKKIEYVQLDSGSCFHAETPEAVRLILEAARVSRERCMGRDGQGDRLRLFYGDPETGRDWLEEMDTMGTIGRSTGTIKVPLLIHNARSTGGPAILDHCIVKITKDHKVLYEHPKYHTGALAVVRNQDLSSEYPWSFTRDGSVVANFREEAKARRFMAFMAGNRNSYAGTAPVPNLMRGRDE